MFVQRGWVKIEGQLIGCVFLAVVVDQIAVLSQFCLTDGAEIFACEIYAIKEAITDSHQRGGARHLLKFEISTAGTLWPRVKA